MKKLLIVLLTTILAFASAAFSAEIDDLAWNESNIKTLRALDKAAVFRLVTDGGPEAPSLYDNGWFEFDWHRAGDGKYELAVVSATGPEIATLTIYWQDASRKVRSQDFYFPPFYYRVQWYKGKEFEDLNGDGKDELILFDPIDHTERTGRRIVPNGAWPQVFRLRDGQYVEASRDFPGFYENEFLPQLDKEISSARKSVEDVAARKAKPHSGIGPSDDFWLPSTRYLAALIMSRDKVLRFLGRDPTAGLAQAREWMTSSDPVMVDNARIVFIDIGGHEEDVRASKLALDRLSKDWLSKSW